MPEEVSTGHTHQLLQEGKMDGLKHYGWGIVDKDGNPFVDDSGVDVCERVYELNSDPESTLAPYRVVELFYKAEQS